MIFLIALQLVYLVALMASCTYAIRAGGTSERYGALIMLIGSVLSGLAVALGSNWNQLENGVFLIDLCVLAALLILALRSDRFWPLWITAFQVIGVATHLARLADPAIIPRAYSMVQGFWAYPMLVVLVIGVRESRSRETRRVARY